MCGRSAAQTGTRLVLIFVGSRFAIGIFRTDAKDIR